MFSKFLNPKNDVAFKKVFGSQAHQNILIRFINDVLELHPGDQIKTVTYLPTAQEPELAIKKQSIVDVLCTDEKGARYIIEMQVAQTAGFEKRAQYYAAKAYSRQLNKGNSDYSQLKEIIFIAIVDYVLFPDKPGCKSDHVILDRQTHEHDLKDFSFTFIELPKFTKSKDEPLENTLDQWCRFFKYAEETDEADLAHIIGNDRIIQEAYKTINRFNWTEAELDAYELELKREMDFMAVQKAAEARGKAEGKAEARAEEQLAMAQKLLAKGMDLIFISEVTGLSQEEISHMIS
jgi:predicted transposase/invertase (TIGR01784 family)